MIPVYQYLNLQSLTVASTKNKKMYYILGDPVIGTFKKLSYERKLGFYFSLLISLVDKYFQIIDCLFMRKSILM